ncbi:uncharacterized protein F4812DRAFT_354860 [Daldinia caldariorum]|uniref:uncharacterized protein n=1 Tax=Daldinia caldariorum TaxID=326644 RepID=UPI00200805C8|nr:uncharacterized protein F4812DRAFT_354860 [Daldinia caldariorum]KAI1469027.1 hypothetical protein F4812DRAFT_354860 [Daldinia caldariorum]
MASGAIVQHHARDPSSSPHTTASDDTSADSNPLLNLLTNSLVLHQIIPYLPISSLLNLAATSPSFRDLLLYRTPGVFRHLDLTGIKAGHGSEVWPSAHLDESITEDDFYSGPLRRVFQHIRRRDILPSVQTLVLDGLSVTAEFCHEILVDPALRVRILSVRDVKNLNERKLMQSLRFACRSTRPSPDGTPRLKALYVFGTRDAPALPAPPLIARRHHFTRGGGANISIDWNLKSQHALNASIQSEGDDWYHKKGRIIGKHIADGWAETLLDCREVIRFDAVLCTSPCHQNSPAFGKVPGAPRGPAPGTERQWSVATFALGGCASCGAAPEGFTVYGESPPGDLPLLAPVPLHSSTIKAATCPKPDPDPHPRSGGSEGAHKFVPRCLDCIRERYCFSCGQWWCEACYQVPSRQELSGQLVHIVGQTNGAAGHQSVAAALPTVKVRKGYCLNCSPIAMEPKLSSSPSPHAP